MNENAVFYKDRINWLSEIQFFRKDLDRMKSQVNIFKEDTITVADENQLKQFSASIEMIDSRLNDTEKNILFSLNNGTNYWVDDCGNNGTSSKKESDVENELFDSMKNCYINLIELLRSIHNYILKKT